MEHGKKTRGFYIALVLITLSAAAIGTAAVINMIQTLSQPPETAQSEPLTQEDLTWGLSDAEVNNGQSDVPITSKPQSTSSNAQSSQASSYAQQSAQSEPAAWQQSQGKAFTLPVSGQTLASFSGDELVYNATMQDWRVHSGTDIACAIGTQVNAPVDGEVISVSNDALWGGTVDIKWGDDTVRICGVNAGDLNAGTMVTQGEKIGTSDVIPAESALEPHIHVEIISNGENTNPEAYTA